MINQEEYEILKSLDNRMKWISRDKNSDIFTCGEKPYKGIVGWLIESIWERGCDFEHGYVTEVKLFQFIQWEDEEPHEIAGLIREYEIKELRLAPSGTVIVDSFDESEETEVKNKEWLKEEVRKLKTFKVDGTKFSFLTFETVSLYKVLDIIKQLDEPEVKQLERKIKELDSYNDELIRDNNQLRNALNNGN